MQVNKYDRQIRLWGTSGQRRLSNAKVLLLGCSGAGIEALKNLVLPGVGQIDIWDDRLVAVEDLSSSFFYGPQDVGCSRAEAAVRNLTEMNPDVTGQAFFKNVNQILKDKPKIQEYTIVICADLNDSLNHQISSLCWDLNIAAIFVTVLGFFVYVRNQKILHCVQSQNTISKKYYMRLHDPFPFLAQHSQRWPIDKLISEFEAEAQLKKKKQLLNQINYIPYPIILIQAYERLQKADRKKDKIKEIIKKWSSVLVVQGEYKRQNFHEAADRTLDLFQPADIFLQDISIFEHPQLANAKADSPSLIIFLKACSQFYNQSGYLPQPTSLPDMHTSTEYYMQLKDTYRHQHELDLNRLQQIIQDLFGNGCLLKRPVISQYVNHVNSLQLMSFSPYFQELETINNPNLPWQNPDWRNILVAIRAYNKFRQNSDHVPTPLDYEQVKAQAEGLRAQYGLQNLDERYLREICRVEGQTTISINSIAGSLAGQEAIKLITYCFTPVRNGFVYEGIHSLGFSVAL